MGRRVSRRAEWSGVGEGGKSAVGERRLDWMEERKKKNDSLPSLASSVAGGG